MVQKEKYWKLLERKWGKTIDGIIEFSSTSKIVIQKIILGVSVDNKEDGFK